MKSCKIPAYFDDFVSCTVIDLRITILHVVEDIESKRAVSRPNLIDDEVFIWEILEQIFREQALSNSLTIPGLSMYVRHLNTVLANHHSTMPSTIASTLQVSRLLRCDEAHLEQLCRRMPYLPSRTLAIRTILGVLLRDHFLEFDQIPQFPKLNGLHSRENVGLLRKVAIMRIVQGIFDEVAHEHPDAARWLRAGLEVVGGDALVGDMLGIWSILERETAVVDLFVVGCLARGFATERASE